jgi:hypothetical protein
MKIYALAELAFIAASGVKAQVVENMSCCPNVTATTTVVPVEETSTLATTTSGQDSCKIYPNGAKFTGRFDYQGVTLTCSDIMSFAMLYESDSGNCTSLESVCCPPMAETPCEVCPDGVTFDGEIKIEGVSVTCSDIISIVMGLELESDECIDVPHEEMELICCRSGGILEIDGGTVATTVVPVEKSSTLATITSGQDSCEFAPMVPRSLANLITRGLL